MLTLCCPSLYLPLQKTKQLLKKLEEEKKKADTLAYIDPAKSEEHKAKGNELYNAGKFIEAIPEYTEALKRDPKNYKVYSNRAAC
jgi:stress-induced-phosphoprotein 1